MTEKEILIMLWEGFPIQASDEKYLIADQCPTRRQVESLHTRGFLVRRRNGDFTLSKLGCFRVCEPQNDESLLEDQAR